MKNSSTVCDKWWVSHLVNPRTGYKIKLNGPTYRKLLSECSNKKSNKTESPTPELRGKRVKTDHIHTQSDPTSRPPSIPKKKDNTPNVKIPKPAPEPRAKYRRYIPTVFPEPEERSFPEQNTKRLKIQSPKIQSPKLPHPPKTMRIPAPPLPTSTTEYETKVIINWYMEYKLSFPMDNVAIYTTFNQNALPSSLRDQMSRYKRVKNIVTDILKYMMNQATSNGLCNKNEFVNILTQVGENYKKSIHTPIRPVALTPEVQPYTVDTVIHWYIKTLNKFPLKKVAFLKVHPDKLPYELRQQPKNITDLSSEIFNTIFPIVNSNAGGISQADFLKILMTLRQNFNNLKY